MPAMTPAELDAFLAGPVFCRLGCLDDDGWPYVVPTWYQYADGGFYIVPRERSAWAEFMRRDERVFLCLDDEEYRRVLVKGRATLLEEPNIGGRWVEMGREVARRYRGEEGAAYLEATLNEPRWLFFVEPLQITSWYGGWANKYKHYDW
jgi:nitroimidazol reductase NimA-like FMN-containing flavoprotein (pyridoxamine 5'-phosphate oxidase superfamily)